MLCLKIAGWVANNVDLHSAASHLGLHCLLRPVCPNTYGKDGTNSETVKSQIIPVLLPKQISVSSFHEYILQYPCNDPASWQWISCSNCWITLKVLTATDSIFIFFFFFSEKIRLGISCELSARKMLHLKCQAYYCLKNNLQKIEHCLPQLYFDLTLLLAYPVRAFFSHPFTSDLNC